MKSKSILMFYSYLILCFLFTSIQQVLGQDRNIFEIKHESSNNGSIISKQVNDELPSRLLYDLIPTIYVKDNIIINVTGPQKPVSLTIYDTNSLNILKTDNPLFDTVQIIKIQLNEISDLNNYLDLSNIKSFNNLSYIYFSCYFKCTENQISEFIKNTNSEITIYFELVDPS